MEASPNDDLSSAEQAFQELREEHRPIREQVSSDPGMSEATRRMLVEHLEEEEQEHIERIEELRAQALSSADPRRTQPGGTQPSVGSLRNAGSGAPASRGSVGSLRPGS